MFTMTDHETEQWGNTALVRMNTVKRADTTKSWRGHGRDGALRHHWDVPNSTATLAKSLAGFWFWFWFFTKLNIHSPYNPAISLFGMYPRRMKTYVHRKICTREVKIVLFITAPNWKQPKCPSAGGEQISCGYLHTLECYLRIHSRTWMNLKGVVPSEPQKVTYYRIPLM